MDWLTITGIIVAVIGVIIAFRWHSDSFSNRRKAARRIKKISDRRSVNGRRKKSEHEHESQLRDRRRRIDRRVGEKTRRRRNRRQEDRVNID